MRYVLGGSRKVKNRFKEISDVVISRTPDFKKFTVELVFCDEFECFFNVIAKIKSETTAKKLAKKLNSIIKN